MGEPHTSLTARRGSTEREKHKVRSAHMSERASHTRMPGGPRAPPPPPLLLEGVGEATPRPWSRELSSREKEVVSESTRSEGAARLCSQGKSTASAASSLQQSGK